MKTGKKPEIRMKGYSDCWEQQKVSDIANRYDNLRVPVTAKDRVPGATPYYGANGIQDYVEGYTHDGEFILVAEDGANDLINYPVQYVTGKIWVNNHAHVLQAIAGKADTRFLGYTISQADIASILVGGSREKLNAETMMKMELLMPHEPAEQKQVGDFLGKIDDLLILHQREIQRLDSVRKAMVDKMFPQNGANVPVVRFDGYSAPWKLCPFSEIFTERHIIDTISDEYPQLAFTIAEGVIRPEDKKTNKRDFLIIDKANKKYLQTEYDDIIYNPANVIFGAIHRNALGKGCVSTIYKIFYTDQDSTFMECIVRHPHFIKEISRSMEGTVKKLRTLKPKAFLNMSAYIAPTIEEQKQIGQFFQQMDRLIEIEKAELEKMQHIKSACLEKMFV